MMFFKIEVEQLEQLDAAERSERAAYASAIQSKTEIMFSDRDYAHHIAVTNVYYNTQKATLCAVNRNGELHESTVAEFLTELDLKYKRCKIQEITLKAYFNLLHTAVRNSFLSDEDDVTDRFNITSLNERYHRGGLNYIETILEFMPERESLLAISRALLCDSTLPVELERIYKGASLKNASGHPVHYLLLTDNRNTRIKMMIILLSALYQNGRIKSRRYCEVSLSGTRSLHEESLKRLYESCAGGTVVASFDVDDSDEDAYARGSGEIIAGLCGAMRSARNNVLTVLCLPRHCQKTKDSFFEHLGTITIVPIFEEAAFGDRAREFLRTLAKSLDARPDKALYKQIEEGKGYSSANLNLMFDEWFDRRLKTKVYAQYAELATVKKQVALEKPKGRAIDELTGMIGLGEAKSVIRQALDFYKAQKLFREKGFTSERPAMHMVFTGNPGTAKTTVARLFAQIMKDNGLLSDGDLHEVGRADLVGKYVGWTADIVKRKFKAAKGGVLFIDEAYSLVDDRDGLYGDEAINTIVQEMENSRGDTVVIFAGYPEKMDAFIQKNPGLRSRIAFHVPFANYDAEELCRITDLLAANKGLKLGDGIHEKLLPIFETAMKDPDFGNGRFARNMLEKAVMMQASRLVAMDVDNVTASDIERLLPDDFEAMAVSKQQTRQIGFSL